MKVATVTIPPNIADVLRAASVEGDSISLGEPGSLPNDVYRATDKVLKLLGFKWEKSRMAHVRTGCNAAKVIAEALATEKVVNLKKTFQFYPTSPKVADRAVELLKLKDGMTVLEPSAGAGALIKAIRRAPWRVEIEAVELDQTHEKVLVGLDLAKLTIGDFLEVDFAGRTFERILANPPFTGGQDARHVRRMATLLSSGGRLVVVVPHNFMERQDKWTKLFTDLVATGEYVLETCEQAGVHEDSGSGIKTVLLAFVRV